MKRLGTSRAPGVDGEVERFFLHRGIPLFIADYDARTRVWTRAFPFLAFVYLLSCLGIAVRPDARRVIETIVQLAILPVAIGIGNLIAGRPLWARPRRVGALHLAAFVIGPTIPLLVDRAWDLVAANVATSLILLAVTYLVVAYGVIPLLVWVIRRTTSALPDLRNAAVRALPMMILFIGFLLYTTEIWQTFGRMRGWPFVTTQLIFAALGAMFVMARLRPDTESVERFTTWDDVYAHAADTPAARLLVDRNSEVVEIPLSKREKRNVKLVVFANQLIMALTVAVVMGLFFLLIGFLTIDAALVKNWLGTEARAIFVLDYQGRRLVLSEEHVRVAVFLATFSAFYFAVYSVSDPSLRDGLRDDGTTQ
ncbi:MAG TPA: hypothetical protein PKV27_06665, partial [Ilumatobacteraceae bacterium]|nr:hypothetical protein [Ilumatobacteraceae bacterium]